jgi:DNA adenine methylase
MPKRLVNPLLAESGSERRPVQQSLNGFHRSRPFIKWVGGKRHLLPALLKRIPLEYGAYHEPFLGGGALFFALAPRSAVLSDSNARLVRTYCGVKSHVEAVIDALCDMTVSREFFEAQRAREIDGTSDPELAAWFIFLNRTGYNGLYRVNRRGGFNVPFGRYVNPRICDAENLRACAQTLTRASLDVCDFEAVLNRARTGDLVYFDPPYIPISRSADFTRYTPQQFGTADQRRLRDVALDLKRRGVHILLSNSAAPEVFALYGEHFTIEIVEAPRFVNSDASGRGKIAETLIS